MRTLAQPAPRIAAATLTAAAAGVPLYWLRVDIAPLCAASAEAARIVLGWGGVAAERAGSVLHAGGFRAEVGIECTALLPVLALWAALWATAPTLHRPLRAALYGALALFGLNTLRIAHLTALGALAPEALWLWHIVLWQALVILSPAALFALAARGRSG